MSTQSIRNVVLVGHNGNGKTSLAEAMLYRAGVIGRMGRVDDGSTVCDYDPIEQQRHQSLSLTTASFKWADHQLNGQARRLRDVVMPFTVPQNMTGLPVAIVAAGFDPDGLPVGLQLTTARGQEATAVTLASALQTALGPIRIAKP